MILAHKRGYAHQTLLALLCVSVYLHLCMHEWVWLRASMITQVCVSVWVWMYAVHVRALCVCLCVCVCVQCTVQTDRQKSQAGRKMCSLKISVLFWHVSSFSAPRQPPLLKHSCPTERQQRIYQLINEGNSGEQTWMFLKMSRDRTPLCF